MKTWIKITLIGFLILILTTTIFVVIFIKKGQEVGSFDVLDPVYQELIEEFPYDAQFSKVENRDDAVQIADVVLKEKFPQIDFFEFYPYDVDYDKINDCWLVVGRQPLCDNVKRAEPHVIISGSGSVLAVLMWG
jgi:hypothetical protein